MAILEKDGQQISRSTAKGIEEARAEGYTLADEKVVVKDPATGRPIEMNPEEAKRFTDAGFGVEGTSESLGRDRAAQLEEQYGGVGGTLEAFGQGALRGATFGLSDVALGALPESQTLQTLQNLQAANPVASAFGEVTGAVAPALLSGGLGASSAVGRALSVTPSALALRAGGSIAARGAGLGALGRAGYAAAGAGLEGALFNSGHYISEVVLQDKELAADAFVAAMGKGALFGAGLGGGLSLLGSLGRAGVEGAGGLLRKGEGLLKRVEEGTPDTTLAKLQPKRMQSPAAQRRAEQTFEQKVTEHESRVDRLLKQAEMQIERQGARAERLAKSADDLAASRERVNAWLAGVRKSTGRPDPAIEHVVPGIGAKFGGGRMKHSFEIGLTGEGTGAFSKGAGAVDDSVKEMRDGISAIASYERDAWQTTNELLRLMDDAPVPPSIAPGAFQTPAQRAAAREATMRQQLGRELTEAELGQLRQFDEVSRLADEAAPFAEAAARQGKKLGEESGLGIGLDDVLALNEVTGMLGFRATDVPVIGPVLGAYLAWRSLGKKLAKGAKLLSKARGGAEVEVAERGAQVRNQLHDTLSAFAKGGAAGVKKAADVAVPKATALASPLFRGEPTAGMPRIQPGSEPTKAQLFDQRAKELTEAQQNPEAVDERIAAQVPAGDPALLKSISDTVKRKLSYLHEKMPKDPTTPDIYGSTWRPSEVEIEEFEERAEAVDSPVETIQRMLSGWVSPLAAEAIKTVYPSLYREAQEVLLENLGEIQEEVPFESRVALSLMFEGAVDRSMRPEFVAAFQEGYAEPAEPAGAQAGLPPSIQGPTNLGESESLRIYRNA